VRPFLHVFTIAGCILTWSLNAFAQQQPGGGGQGGINQGGNQQNNAAGGITIDAKGLVAPGFVADQSSKLDRKRREALAAKNLPADVNAKSDCRMVSLVWLEKQVQAALDKGEPLPDDVRCLAGLQRIDYLFVDPDHNDLLIAGPAEGFAPDASGRQRGVTTGRPTLLLDDLIVALRTVPGAREVGCSIDPTSANLAALQQYVKQNSSPATPQVIEGRYVQMAKALGLCDVRVDGVPADSHFGRVLVEADYRMKRIALGVENPGVKGLRSHLSMIGGGNSIQRWWFVPLYDGLYVSEDRLAYELVGQRAQLLSQDEFINATGDRFAAATTRLSTQAFAKQFTERYADLADESPVYAELQNLIDWCVIVALIDREQLADRVGWKRSLFLNAEKLPHESGPAPKQVPAIANARRVNSGTIIGLVAGGVTIRARSVSNPAAIKTDPARRLDSTRASHIPRERPAAHPWWWD
jgi:hypothetical protein